MDLVSEDMLVQALSPEPRDFTNLAVRKTYEKVVDGKYHVGFEAFVITYDGFPFQEGFTDVLLDKGYCVFSPGSEFHDDYVSQDEKTLEIDDPFLPENVREAWVAYWSDSIDLDDAKEYLSRAQANSSATVRAMCQKIHERAGGA